eukprot:ctg_2375.g570
MCLALVASRLRAVRAAAGADGDDDDVDVSDYFGAGDEAGGTDAVPVHPSLGDDDNNKEEAEPTAKIDPAARGGDYSVQRRGVLAVDALVGGQVHGRVGGGWRRRRGPGRRQGPIGDAQGAQLRHRPCGGERPAPRRQAGAAVRGETRGDAHLRRRVPEAADGAVWQGWRRPGQARRRHALLHHVRPGQVRRDQQGALYFSVAQPQDRQAGRAPPAESAHHARAGPQHAPVHAGGGLGRGHVPGADRPGGASQRLAAHRFPAAGGAAQGDRLPER